MIVDIAKLNMRKEYSGRLEFDYEAPENLIEIPFVQFEGAVHVDALYELYEDDALEIRGTLSYKIKGQCSRCLNPAEKTIEGEIDALFEKRTDAEDYSYSGTKVDLRPAIDDAIMASLPFLLTCSEGCEGLSYSDETV